MTTANDNQYQSTFFIIPSYITKLPGITWTFIKVYEAIFQFWNKGQQCFRSDADFMQMVDCEKSQLHEAFAFFEKHNELKRVRRKGKRYIIRPEKPIEYECTEIEPTSGETEEHFRRSGSSTSGGAEHNIKKLNKEKNKPPIVPRGDVTKKTFSLENMLEDNPHTIPKELIEDWLIVRKKKRADVTRTAWKFLNNALALISQETSVNAITAFETMVASGWLSLKLEYFSQQIAPKEHNKQTVDVEKAQEEAYKQRIAMEQENNYNKQHDAIIGRKLKKAVSNMPKGFVKGLIYGNDQGAMS